MPGVSNLAVGLCLGAWGLYGGVLWSLLAGAVSRAGYLFHGPGDPVGTDFFGFHLAARLSLDGHPVAAIYDTAAFQALQHAATGQPTVAMFPYPPTALAFFLPFGALPYPVALALWTVAGVAAFGVAVCRLLPDGLRTGRALIVVTSGTAVFLAVLHGQVSLFVAAGLAIGVRAVLDGRSVTAGLAFAVVFLLKLQLGAVPLLALLLSGDRRAVVTAAGAVAAAAAAVTAAFGGAGWTGFIGNLHAVSANAAATTDMLTVANNVSIGSAVRLVGGGAQAAWIVGWLAFALALLGVLWTFVALSVTTSASGTAIVLHRRFLPARVKWAVAIAASALAAPYVSVYDLVILAIPVCLLVGDGIGHRAGAGMLVAVWLLPGLHFFAARAFRIPVVQMVELFGLVDLLLVPLWRCRRVFPASAPPAEPGR